MHYYERHIGDYLKDTAHLSLLEHGVYARLMDVYYTREGGIPEKDVHRLIGARTPAERQAMQDVLTEFFELVEGHWIQSRCDREIGRFKEKQDKARKSAEARWGHPTGNANASKNGGTGDAPGMRSHSPSTTNAMPRARASHQPTTTNQPPTPGTNNQASTTDRPVVTPAETPPGEDSGSVGPSVGGNDFHGGNSNGNGHDHGCTWEDVSSRLAAIGIPKHRLQRPRDRDRISAWIEAGCTPRMLDEAIEEASQSKPPTELSTGYLDPIVTRVVEVAVSIAEAKKRIASH